jgi:hypothetical protein
MTEHPKEWKQAKIAYVVKFSEVGASLSGTFIGYEVSKMYPDSFILKVNDGASVVGVFVNKVAIDLMKSANILQGQKIKLVYKGKIKNVKGTQSYHTYHLFYI